LLCVDAANHLPNRENVLAEWRRVLKPGGRLLWTDPVVITGPVTNEELALRSSIGTFVFVPDGANERLLTQSGFAHVEREDTSEAASQVAGRWRDARAREREGLLTIEGAEGYEGLQAFLDCVHRLTGERRLSRIVYRCT
jgi:ubiquinone/menaquinone biosynthesis C-methylase UbiE